MAWHDITPWANRKQQQKTGEVDTRQPVHRALQPLIDDCAAGRIDAETLAFSAYAIGFGDGKALPPRFGHDTEVQT